MLLQLEICICGRTLRRVSSKCGRANITVAGTQMHAPFILFHFGRSGIVVLVRAGASAALSHAQYLYTRKCAHGWHVVVTLAQVIVASVLWVGHTFRWLVVAKRYENNSSYVMPSCVQWVACLLMWRSYLVYFGWTRSVWASWTRAFT